ncbi:hypothetical protein HGRIS_007818 [Hohenbuehelia grisea]|uniref:Uncharacterized protein n=1 Tax=Hohenbuehelia grisea TaxID=104357 RepID=A0ABR3J604_9AGAR
MRFFTTLAAFVSVTGSLMAGVAAAPAEKDWKYALGWDGVVSAPESIGAPVLLDYTPVPRGLEKRTPGGVFICTNINWGGTCGYAVQQLNSCIALTAPWLRTISSFGPDPGARCFAYSQNSCSEAQWSFTHPGDATGGLGTNDPWNDKISNFRCTAA